MVACPFGVMQVVVTPQAAGQVKASAQKCDLCRAARRDRPVWKTVPRRR
jgi:Fe-S-cluster-containing hydrogenase component 2